MPLRSVGCVDIYGLDGCFSLDLRLSLPGLLLLILYAVILIMLRGKFCRNLAVEGGQFGFELLQLILLAPRLGDDCFKLGNIGFEFRRPFLLLGDDAGYLLQSVDEVYTGGMGVAHCDVAVVVLVFVVSFDNKTVLNTLLAVNQCPFGYD